MKRVVYGICALILFVGLYWGASGTASAQGATGSVAVGPYAVSGGNGPALGGVCVRLFDAGEFDQTECSVVGQNVSSSAIFDDVPVGDYTVELVSAPAGCTTRELPASVHLNEGALFLLNPAFDCGSSTMEIHLSQCTDDVADLFSCHDNRIEGGEFFILDGGFVWTDANGVASGSLLAGETYITQVSVPGDVLRVYTYCTNENDGSVLFDGVADGGLANLVVPGGATVVCDVYDIVAAAIAPTPTATAPAEVTPAPTQTATVTSLPNTGSGASGGAGTSSWKPTFLFAMLSIGAFAVLRLGRKDVTK